MLFSHLAFIFFYWITHSNYFSLNFISLNSIVKKEDSLCLKNNHNYKISGVKSEISWQKECINIKVTISIFPTKESERRDNTFQVGRKERLWNKKCLFREEKHSLYGWSKSMSGQKKERIVFRRLIIHSFTFHRQTLPKRPTTTVIK